MILSQGKPNQTERRKNKMSEKCDASWLNRAKKMTKHRDKKASMCRNEFAQEK